MACGCKGSQAVPTRLSEEDLQARRERDAQRRAAYAEKVRLRQEARLNARAARAR